MHQEATLYRNAGVDLGKANDLVKRIQPLVRSTFHAGVITDIGGFGALYSFNGSDFKNPVLVSSTDGVGTKLKVAFWANRHDTVGIDLVAMCVNDIVVQGARPLFFLDYLAMGKIDLDQVELIIRGVVAGCRVSNCSLIGGETAEMPGFYQEGEYDLAGFAVGIVENSNIIDGSSIRVGDQIIGLASSGLHSNGYSLVRQIIFDKLKLQPDSIIPECRRSVADELLEPTRIYVETVLNIARHFRIAGMAHITGGGLYDNIPRILPKACQALIYENAWEPLPIFTFLKEAANIPQDEMYRVFNTGIGFVMVVSAEDCDEILQRCAAMGQTAYRIGEITGRPSATESVRIVPA